MSEVIDLAAALIKKPSVTPDDAGCQELICGVLQKHEFECETLVFEDVTNLWASHGQSDPVFCFAGHTDVVPSGPAEQWQSPPFEPVIDDAYLCGRGAADMKGSLAAMICASRRFVSDFPDHPGTIAFLITSDEEGIAINGTKRVIETLQNRSQTIDYCVVGEPSSSKHIGDVVRVGRRGSLNLRIRVQGVQGHVAFPEKARNPVHEAAGAITDLCAEVWDQGNEFFPATSFQISNINAGTGVSNVIPGELVIDANFRYSTAITRQELADRTEKILSRHNLDYDIEWQLSGEPFLSKPGKLTEAVLAALSEVADMQPELSTGGGTSDGRFIAPTGTEVIELGPVNATIHQINEKVSVADLMMLEQIYYEVLKRTMI